MAISLPFHWLLWLKAQGLVFLIGMLCRDLRIFLTITEFEQAKLVEVLPACGFVIVLKSEDF